MISARLKAIQEEISSVCSRLGRNPEDVTLVGVTKYTPVEAVIEAVEAGLCHIGENRVQDAKEKFAELDRRSLAPVKHLIGHLQTNKVKEAVKLFDLIQSVDSIKLTGEIEKQAAKIGKTIDILVQVNIAGEEQKYGVSPDETDALVEEAASCEHIRVLGLMAMAPLTNDVDEIRHCFKGLKQMFDRYAEIYREHKNVRMQILSMGMTQDYVTALEEGSNMIRVGRAIFQ